MYINHAQHTPRHFSVMIRGFSCIEVGCLVVWTREAILPHRGLRYQSQKTEEVGEGTFSRRVSGWWGLAFVPTPPPGSPEKITEQADSSRLQALPSDWLRRASRCWRCSRGFRWFQHVTLTPRDGLPAPAAPTRTPLKQGPSGSQHTPLAPVILKASDTLCSASFTKDEHKCFLLDYVCFWNVLWVLSDRTWIHSRVILTN